MAVRQLRNRKVDGRMNRRAVLLMAALATLTARQASGQTSTFIGTLPGSDWNNAGNWSGGIPGTGSTALIDPTPGIPIVYDDNYTSSTAIGTLILDSGGTVQLYQTTSGDNLYSANEYIGNAGDALYEQTTATNSMSGALVLGNEAGSGGVYLLEGGSLVGTNMGHESAREIIGAAGSGELVQSGGNNIAGTLVVGENEGASGTYALEAGSLSVLFETIGLSGAGTFDQSGGNNSVTAFNGLIIGDPGGGTYTLSGTGVLSVSGGVEQVGVAGAGSFTQTGGTNTAGTLWLGVEGGNGTGSYSLSGTGSLAVSGSEYVGYTGAASTFTQTGGTNAVGGELILGYSSGALGTYTLSGTGVLSCASTEEIGGAEYGSFTQSGGTNTAQAGLIVASSNVGTYSLSAGGSLASNGSEEIGGSSLGTFVQTGGTNTVGGTLYLGYSNGGTGSYYLSGTGSLSTSVEEIVGFSGSGTFTQSAGTNTMGALIVAESGTMGTYSLSGTGTLSATGIEIVCGAGTFAQSGGTNDGADGLVIGTPNGSIASYTMSGGTASISNGEVVVGGTSPSSTAVGSLIITGGSFTAGELAVGNAPGTSLSLSGGTLSASALNFSNPSLFFWTAGTLNLTSPLTIDSTNLGPTLNLSSSQTLQGTTLANNTAINMSGGTISVSGLFTNNLGQISGNGVLAGNGAFYNDSLLTQSGGNLVLNAAGGFANTSSGTINLAAAEQLEVNGGGLSNSGLINLNGGQVTGSAALTNAVGGLISGPGTITAALVNKGTIALSSGNLNLSTFTNNGTIDIAGISAIVNGGTISNAGTIQGYGTIVNQVLNTSGTIEATGDGVLQFDAAVTNTGLLAAGDGNKLLLTQGLTNSSGGIVSLTGGTLDTASATLTNSGQITGYGTIRSGGLTNNGAMTLTGGTSTVNGPVINSTGETINIKYQPAIFTGSVTNNGTIKTTDTTVTFTGPYSGNAYISDPSTNIFQNNVTVVSGGEMTGSTGDQYFMSGGTFTNQGKYSNTGFLQSSDPTTNSGTFTQGGTQNWSAGTVFTNTAGTATFASDAGSATAYDLSVNATGGTVALGSPQHWAALSISGAAKLDIENNHLLIGYGSGADPIASIAALLATGYAGGAWNGAGGIVTSAPLLSGGLLYGLGYADAADPGNPAGLSSGTIEIKYTLLGDADLSGVVDGVDFGIVAANFNKGVSRWDQGDFNYDNVVDGTDFGDLAANFNKGASGAAVGPGALSDPTLVAFAEAHGLMADVPEPTVGGLLALSSALGLRRRRKSC